jgi:hypothetical protein
MNGATYHAPDGDVMDAPAGLAVLRLNDEGGSLRSSLPGLLGRAYERIFYGPNVRFEWPEVRLVESVERFAVLLGVRFEILQEGELEWFILNGSERTVAEILDYAQAKGANLSHLKRHTWRVL